ncbi:MAG: AAA family ATPase [Clostridia bacterium]|nr:AAA family ATPase [Clostridia bacterium]NCC42503.1 AAA family ATPase [Clostridia bacterium]
MNIQEAKAEVIHTVQAYTAQDENGHYRIPRLRQRPVLLMGPPGIGKTAVVEQAAAECGVGLVSYTITHHTRQSAVGLPVVKTKIYGGQEMTVTEYTMSEIIASVYDCMEATGHQKGILFIDEVNCVSETLAPTMLQFLQGKTFGNHKVPSGWVIVAAGNPTEYNKSAREFDIVTLDRVKKIDVEVDYQAWKGYAISREIHGAIRSYLDQKPQCFYQVDQSPEGKEFVTARGWEDLSVILNEYEKMKVKIDENLIGEYIQCADIAQDFTAYYHFYQKYQERYQGCMDGLFEGDLIRYDDKITLRDEEMVLAGLAECTLDEQLTLANLFISQTMVRVSEWKEESGRMARLKEVGLLMQQQAENSDRILLQPIMEDFFSKRDHALKVKEEAGILGEEELELEYKVDRDLKKIFGEMKEQGVRSWQKAWELYGVKIQELDDKLEEKAEKRAEEMERVLLWLKQIFGEGPAFLAVMEAFTAHEGCMQIIRQKGCAAYENNCGLMMTGERERQLRKQLEQMQGTPISL